MVESNSSFHEMVNILGLSKAPLSVRLDVDYKPTVDELQVARRAIGHVMADSEVRGRLASLKVEPLVRAAAIVLEDAKRAKVARAQREIAESIVQYLDALDRAFGNVPSVLNNRGLARSLAGDIAGGDADFASARRLAPTFAAPRINEIALIRKKGDMARLERVATEIESGDPGNIEALRALVDAKVGLKRPAADVLALAERLHEAKGARPSDLLLLGSLKASDGNPEHAEGFLRDFVAAEPKSVEGHQRLASVLLELGKFPEAVAVYERLTEIDGPKHGYWLALALTYDKMDRVEDASSAFAFALDHASADDHETVEDAFKEFNLRRRIGLAEGQAPAPAPLVQLEGEEPDIAEPRGPVELEPEAGGAESLAPDLSGEGYEPKAVGEAELFALSKGELPVEEPVRPVEAGAPAPSAESAPHSVPDKEVPIEAVEVSPAPPPSGAAPEPAEREPTPEVRLAEALEAAAGVESADEIMGESPPEPRLAARQGDAGAQEEAPSESIVVAPSEAIVATPARTQAPAEPSVQPVVSAAPPQAERTPAGEPELTAALSPVVSAPPPEKLDEELTAELDALAASDGTPEAPPPGEVEPFRRPAFDVDEFMAALEAKTKPVFDHLYDGMLEARRKDAAEGKPAQERPTAMYESAPPTERPSVQVAPGPFPAAAAETAAPERQRPAADLAAGGVMPALLKEGAKEAIVEAARETRPADATLLAQSEAFLRAGDDRAAEEAIDAYLRGFPDDAHGWNLMGDLRERAGDEDGAIRSYWKAVKYDPSHREAWNNLGVILHVAGRMSEAAGALESAVRASPDDRHLWHNLGSTYHELGRLEDALKAFNRAIEIDPSDKVSYNNKGTTLFELADFAGARACFEKAASIDPRFEQALNNLGRALEKLNDREGAVHSFEAALALNERSGTALKNLARVLRELGRQGEAAAAESRLRALST